MYPILNLSGAATRVDRECFKVERLGFWFADWFKFILDFPERSDVAGLHTLELRLCLHSICSDRAFALLVRSRSLDRFRRSKEL
jgi:hypothetical protein